MKSERDKKTGNIGKGRAGPGRPKGARNKVSQAARTVLEDQGGAVVKKVIDAAVGGDMAAGRALLPFLLPKAERVIHMDLGTLETPLDVVAAYGRLSDQLRAGSITEADLAAADRVLSGWMKAYETHNLSERLSRVEEQIAKSQAGS